MPLRDPNRYARDFFKLPRPALRQRWLGEYEGVTTHMHGRVAKRLIGIRRPYEPSEIMSYRLANYEAVTQGPFKRSRTNLQRVFGSSQVSIEIGDEVVRDYINGPNFAGTDMRSYWSRNLVSRMLDDPNGLLIWWVDAVPALLTERVTPRPYMILSHRVQHITEDAISWLSNELSSVIVTDPADASKEIEVRQGRVYYVVTDTEYWKLVQYGRKEDALYRLDLHYRHQLNRLPVYVLGGEPKVETNEKTNEDEHWFGSYFGSAVPYANECARQWSDHQGVMVTMGYPIREVKPIRCTAAGCRDGKVYSTADDDTTEITTCQVCSGRGTIAPPSMYGVLVREEAGALEDRSRAAAEVPMVRFLHPEVPILDKGEQAWRNYLRDVERELDLLFVDEAQSGKAKEIDREGQVAKLDLIGNHLFQTLFRNSLRDVTELLKRPWDPAAVSITLPPTFVVRTESDLVNELKSLTEAQEDGIVRVGVQHELASKRFAGNLTVARSIEVLSGYDVLYGMTTEAVSALSASGTVVDDLLLRRHVLARAALQRLIMREGPAVLEAQDIFAKLDAMVEEIMPASRIVPKPVDEPPVE